MFFKSYNLKTLCFVSLFIQSSEKSNICSQIVKSLFAVINIESQFFGHKGKDSKDERNPVIQKCARKRYRKIVAIIVN